PGTANLGIVTFKGGLGVVLPKGASLLVENLDHCQRLSVHISGIGSLRQNLPVRRDCPGAGSSGLTLRRLGDVLYDRRTDTREGLSLGDRTFSIRTLLTVNGGRKLEAAFIA